MKPEITAQSVAEKLARDCAAVGLDMRAARMVFHACYIASALASTGNNRTAAARKAGINRATLSRSLNGLGGQGDEVAED